MKIRVLTIFNGQLLSEIQDFEDRKTLPGEKNINIPEYISHRTMQHKLIVDIRDILKRKKKTTRVQRSNKLVP